jgi:serine/threonine protein kinase
MVAGLNPAPSPPVREGDVVAGKYRVERVLGAGGMGVVVAASHLHLQQRVAIKFLLPGVVAGPEAMARFLREARAAARIQSEYVARVLDAATLEDGTPFMVMEFLEGRDLAALLAERGPLPLQEAVGYILQACEGIAEAHAAGIVHRDLKPSNFFLCERGGGRQVVKVLDFGVSKVAGGSATQPELSLTGSAAFLGSPLYMSPEQMASAKEVDERADIWSLGVTLFELVSARVPFGGDSVTEVIAGVLQKPPLSLREVSRGVPPAFEAALARSLEKPRERRYQNVAEFAAAVAPFGPRHAALSVERISDALGAARTAGVPLSPGLAKTIEAPATTAQPVSSDRPELPPGGEHRRSRTSWWVAAAGLVAVVGLGGAAVMKRTGSESKSESKTVAAAQLPPLAPATASAPSPALATTSPPAPLLPDVAASTAPLATASAGPAHRAPATRPAASLASPAPPSSKGAASTPPPPPAALTTCHVVQYFDPDGEPRFKRECP